VGSVEVLELVPVALSFSTVGGVALVVVTLSSTTMGALDGRVESATMDADPELEKEMPP
jgi:hypothetical protein